MRPRISIRGSVCPSVCLYVHPSVNNYAKPPKTAQNGPKTLWLHTDPLRTHLFARSGLFFSFLIERVFPIKRVFHLFVLSFAWLCSSLPLSTILSFSLPEWIPGNPRRSLPEVATTTTKEIRSTRRRRRRPTSAPNCAPCRRRRLRRPIRRPSANTSSKTRTDSLKVKSFFFLSL